MKKKTKLFHSVKYLFLALVLMSYSIILENFWGFICFWAALYMIYKAIIYNDKWRYDYL